MKIIPRFYLCNMVYTKCYIIAEKNENLIFYIHINSILKIFYIYMKYCLIGGLGKKVEIILSVSL